jgi:hypothetical protein
MQQQALTDEIFNMYKMNMGFSNNNNDSSSSNFNHNSLTGEAFFGNAKSNSFFSSNFSFFFCQRYANFIQTKGVLFRNFNTYFDSRKKKHKIGISSTGKDILRYFLLLRPFVT